MEILVKHKHFKQAEDFSSTSKCPLAMAILEQTVSDDVVVLFESVRIDGKRYKIVGGYHYDADRYQSGKFKGYTINELIAYAKSNPSFSRIPTKKIKLVEDED